MPSIGSSRRGKGKRPNRRAPAWANGAGAMASRGGREEIAIFSAALIFCARL
jgi:hypothetical protein